MATWAAAFPSPRRARPLPGDGRSKPSPETAPRPVSFTEDPPREEEKEPLLATTGSWRLSPITRTQQQSVFAAPQLVLDGVDRSQWKKTVLQRNPEIKELRERVFPLQRATTFVELHQPPIDDTETERRARFMKLVMQALHYYGYTETLRTLEREFGTAYEDPEAKECMLKYHLRTAIQRTERVYDLMLAPEPSKDTMDLLEGHLSELGLTEDTEDDKQDVDIWEEPEEGNVIRDGDNITGGTLNKLVEKLTAEKTPDPTSTKTFLMTYQSFTTPRKLLEKLFQRYEVPLNRYKGDDNMRLCIQLRVVSALKKWLDDYPADFDVYMLEQLNEWLDQKTADGSLAAKSREALEKSMRKGQQPTTTTANRKPPPEPQISDEVMKIIFSTRFVIHDIDELELARQLTLVDFEIFRRIKPSELLNQAWSKPHLRHRAPNVTLLTDRFNKVAYWVTLCILKKKTIKLRVKMAIRWLNVIQHLREINNFSGIMSVGAAFNQVAFDRLKFTKEALPERHLQILAETKALTNTTNGYQAIRDALAGCNPPCFPYLGIYLTDLVRLEEHPDNLPPPKRPEPTIPAHLGPNTTIPDIVGKGIPNNNTPKAKATLINFSKRRKVYDVIANKLQQYQQLTYNFQPVHQVQRLLLNLPHVAEEELYRMSHELEPRGAERSQIA